VNPLKKRFPIGKGLDICDQGILRRRRA
jgi:hypothetical protein